jgi:hypothetical protein
MPLQAPTRHAVREREDVRLWTAGFGCGDRNLSVSPSPPRRSRADGDGHGDNRAEHRAQ